MKRKIQAANSSYFYWMICSDYNTPWEKYAVPKILFLLLKKLRNVVLDKFREVAVSTNWKMLDKNFISTWNIWATHTYLDPTHSLLIWIEILHCCLQGVNTMKKSASVSHIIVSQVLSHKIVWKSSDMITPTRSFKEFSS